MHVTKGMEGAKIETVPKLGSARQAPPPTRRSREVLSKRFGRVRFVNSAGSGGMAEVWNGITSDGRYVAVKVLSTRYAKNELARKRFARECSITTKLRHPRVATGLDAGESADGRQYLIMRFLGGSNLGVILAKTPMLPLRRVRIIIAQLRDAIEYVHSMGIYHRDIKPSNIMFASKSPSASLHLIDFGIASAPGFASLTKDRELIGTVQYMSPEQIFGSTTQPIQTDLWALSVVAYECLSGRPPFDAASLGKLCGAIRKGVFTPPSYHRDELGSQFDGFFNRAFDENVTQRFRSIDEWHEAFENAGPEGAFRGVIRLPRLHEVLIERHPAASATRGVFVRSGSRNIAYEGELAVPSLFHSIPAGLPVTVNIGIPDLSYCMTLAD